MTDGPSPVCAPDAELQARLQRLQARFPRPAQRELLQRAYARAADAHGEQCRRSGEPYISHPLAVAELLADLGLDAEALAATLLHDVIEDTGVDRAAIAAEFGETIARLVDGVTKIGRIGRETERALLDHGAMDPAQAENLRKLLLAMADDVRVILIKLADRLHNVRTLGALDEADQRRIAEETLEIYAPLANRLGIWQFKWELEDLSLRHLKPEVYRSIAKGLNETRAARDAYIRRVLATIQASLVREGIHAEVSGRPKHIYSLWRKMRRKRVGLDEIFDQRAIRILVDKVADCYAALGVVHGLWRHIPKEFDDYIANPKSNNYQSLHTAVVGPEGKTLEVQIRTHDMHAYAELGVAAHWAYKEGVKGVDQALERKIAWLRQLLEWGHEEDTAGDFVDRFKSETGGERVYVLTPQWRVLDLPAGATPLDFAYYVHTDLGHRCRGARIDGHIVPLTHELRTGEQVEILSTRRATPSRDWLNPHLGYLRTKRARAKVRAYFRAQDQEKNIAAGRVGLDRELSRLGLAGMAPDRIAERMHYARVDDLLAALGAGDINLSQIAGAAQSEIQREQREIEAADPAPARLLRRQEPRRGAGRAEGVRVEGVGNLLTSMAKCCRPVPPDPIVGYITRGRGVTIHRQDCAKMLNLKPEERARLIQVDWGGAEAEVFPVDIQVRAYDRSGLLRDVGQVLSAEKINVIAVNTRSDKKTHTALMHLTVEISDLTQLSRLLARLGQLPNVVGAERRPAH